jgi:hypothetical protein
MNGIYPEVGTVGVIKVSVPYQSHVSDRVMWECTKVQSLEGLLAEGYAPFEDYYEPYGIDGDVYKEDVALNAKIVTFRSSDGHIVSLPNRFIETLPNPDGVIYQSIAIGVLLSIVPEGFETTTLEKEIAQLCMKRYGIAATTQMVITGADVLLTHDQHKAIVGARKVDAAETKTYLLQLEELKVRYDELRLYADRLEQTAITLQSRLNSTP